MEAFAAITAINNAFGIAKALRGIEHQYDAATFKMKLAELMESLAEIKIEHIELAERYSCLEKENQRLLEADSKISDLIAFEGYLFLPDNSGSPTGWPSCPTCIATAKIVTIMVQTGRRDAALCPRCKSTFDPVPSFVAPGLTRAKQRNERAAANMQSFSRSQTWR
ncbi:MULTISPECIES: hypothetical protein [unclassified Novosphingobium]|uniref:hypothetical protein n=1 Tax=unclassified Novosphingobium TaxID=2644732 RepID=UPI00105EE67E|nr:MULTISPECIES: hypothetical protein [unclassified Novosphingobium]